MRFLADMGISISVVKWLRETGHDAVHLTDENLQRMPDSEVFRKAYNENRIVLTFDLDFGEILALSEGRNVSVILFRLHNARAMHVISRTKRVLEDASEALSEGSIIVVEEGRHRIRRLPL